MIDKNLSWKPHVEYICKKISKACGSLANLRYSVQTHILREVYHSLIHSYLRYGIVLWGNACDITLQPLKVLINRAVRIMTFTPFGRIDLNPLYNFLSILNLDNVRYFETSKLLYKLKNNLIPTSIANHFEFKSDQTPSHNYSLRNRERAVPQIVPRLESGKNSIQYRGELIWNVIPQMIRSCNSLNKFKTAMKQNLIGLQS